MTDDLDAIHRRMIAETMRPCRELPLGERVEKREDDRRVQRAVEEMAAQAVDDAGGKPIRGAA